MSTPPEPKPSVTILQAPLDALIATAFQLKAERAAVYGMDWTLPDLALAELTALRSERDEARGERDALEITLKRIRGQSEAGLAVLHGEK